MARQPYTGEERRQANRGITFDKPPHPGPIPTAGGSSGLGMVTWSTLDKRVVVLEESRKAQELRDTGQDDRNRDQMTAIRETLTEIKQNVIALRDRQDRTKE